MTHFFREISNKLHIAKMKTHLKKNISAVKYQILSDTNIFGFILTNQINYMNLNNLPP